MFVLLSINYCIVEAQPNGTIHCTSIVMCFKSKVNVKASLHTNENISIQSCLSAYEYIHK